MSSSDEVRPAARSAGPLDRIEAALREPNPMRWERISEGDVLALVNVAKAAEAARVEHRLATKVGPGQHFEGDYVCNEDGSKAHAPDCSGCALREALAALNKEPA